MPQTIDEGMVATDDPLAADLKVSMADKVANKDVDTTQFMSIMMKLPASQARSFKEEWLEDEYLAKNTALAVTAAAADTALTITTNEGHYFKVGDIGKFVQTGEAFRVTTKAASAVTVVRGIGSVAAATAASGTAQGGIVIISGSNEQGAELPTAMVTEKTSNYNYAGIIRNSFRFTNTAQWTGWYSGNPLAYARLKVGIEHKREAENTVFFGARSYTAGTNGPRASTGGFDQYISTNITTVNGTLDKGAWADFMRSGMEYGHRDRKVLYVSPIVSQVLSEFAQDNWVRTTPGGDVWGVKVDYVIEGVWGKKVPVFVKGDWKRYGEVANTPAIGSRAYLIDMANVELKRAPNVDGPRFFGLYKDREAPSADETAEEYMSEFTLCIKSEQSHALLRGVTG